MKPLIFFFENNQLAKRLWRLVGLSLAMWAGLGLSPAFAQPLDSMLFTRRDSAQRFSANDTLSVQYANQTLEAPVQYDASDSMRFDLQQEQVHLFGNAVVKYLNYELKAGYIIFDWGKNLVIAEGRLDSSGRMAQYPVFTDGEQAPVVAKKIRYNFITKKGIVNDVTTEQSGGYVRGGMAKIVGKQDSIAGSTDVFYSKNAIYTTCDHETPHFGIRSTKQKVILDKVAIVGPSNLEIAGIPTPLWLPFAFFPLAKGQSSGLLFPRNYQFDPQAGFGLLGIGWYFALGDHANLSLTSDIYTRGSWGLKAVSAYKRNYKYTGSLNMGYSVRKVGDPEIDGATPKKSFSIAWSHSQDAKAHPTQRFSANVSFQTNNYAALNQNDANSVLTNTYSSGITYSKNWSGKPYSFNASFNHSQNTQTRLVNVTFPRMDFRVNRLAPFDNPADGKEHWYEKIGFNYNASLQNQFAAADTALFDRATLQNAKFGFKHELPVNASFKLFKYINLTPSVQYSEKWYAAVVQKSFDPSLVIQTDTLFDADNQPISIQRDTTFGTIAVGKDYGLRALREFSASLSVSTQLFGMLRLGRGQAIRHVAKPSVSFSYTPDYTSSFWGYFGQVQYDTRYPLEYQTYNLFEGGIFGAASQGGGQAISFNLANVLEGKFRKMEDSVAVLKKVSIVQNLVFSANYNLAADSLNMSVVNMSGNTKLFKQVSVNFGATFDPLAANRLTNRRIDTWEWERNKRLVRLTNARLSLTTSLKPEQIREMFSPKSAARPTPTAVGGQRSFVQSLNFTYEVRFVQQYVNGTDSFFVSTNNLRLSGTAVNLTQHWKLNVGGIGYDFVSKSLTYPDFQLSRDLHCWDFGLSWQPQRGTYMFNLRVKPGQLDFINIPYQRSNFDPLGGF